MKLLNYTSEEKENLYKIGIYKISFKNDKKNRVYIGSALIHKNRKNHRGFYHRWTRHLEDLTANKHANCKLQNACNKYGIDNMRFEIVDILNIGHSNEYYNKIETYYITKFNSVKNGFNVAKNGKNRKGIPCSEQIKIAISIANSGNKNGMFGRLGNKHPNAKKVYQYSPMGNFVKEWDCARIIQNELGFNYKDISACCLGKKRICRGYKWFYSYQGNKIEPFKVQNYRKKNE